MNDDEEVVSAVINYFKDKHSEYCFSDINTT